MTQTGEDWSSCISFYSYIKPQLSLLNVLNCFCCISFYSYIKPQPAIILTLCLIVVYRSIPTSNRNTHEDDSSSEWVVYRSIPTSNRNFFETDAHRPAVVYRSIPTSNRNEFWAAPYIDPVVYRSIPTSNRNFSILKERLDSLYIVLFLHQTATQNRLRFEVHCCISFYSYIKPQRIRTR